MDLKVPYFRQTQIHTEEWEYMGSSTLILTKIDWYTISHELILQIMGLQWDVYQYQLVPDFLQSLFRNQNFQGLLIRFHWNCDRTGKQGWKIHHLYMIQLKPPWFVRGFPIAIFG